jgi:Zinc finger, C3HC4 type (RING finger)
MDFQGIQKHLKLLENSALRCNVCRNHLSNASCLAGCGHSFCNTCLSGRDACPECHVPISDHEKDIVPNRLLNEAVQNYKQLSSLDEDQSKGDWTLLEFTPSSSSWSETDIFVEYNMPKALSGLFQSLSCQYCGDLLSNAVCIKVCGHSFCYMCIRRVFQSNPTGMHRQKNTCITCRAETGQSADKQLVINRALQHAVIHFKNVVRSFHGINVTTAEKSAARSARSRSVEEPITTRFSSRNYSKMKAKDLRDLCKHYGLSCRGGDQEVIDRIKLFAIKWNAELQSIAPKTPSEILDEMNQLENAHRNEQQQSFSNGLSHHSDLLKRINNAIDHKNGSAGVVRSGNQHFDARFYAGFAKLEEQGRKLLGKTRGNSDYTIADRNEEVVSSGHDEIDNGASADPAACVETGAEQESHRQHPECVDTKVECTGVPLSESPRVGRRSFNNFSLEEEDDSSVVVLSDNEAKASTPCNNVDSANNKENNTSSSPPFPKINVLPPSKHSASDGRQSSSIASATRTPSTKRPPPSSTGSAGTRAGSSHSTSRRRRIPWSCPKCTFENDGTVNGVCVMCRHARVPVL